MTTTPASSSTPRGAAVMAALARSATPRGAAVTAAALASVLVAAGLAAGCGGGSRASRAPAGESPANREPRQADRDARPTGREARGRLRLSRVGLGRLRPGMAIDRATLARLAPGYEVAVVEDSFEGEAYEVFELRVGGDTLVRVAPASGSISAITVLSAEIESETGVTVGTGFPAALAAMGPLRCELTYHDDMFPEQATCTPVSAPDWNIVFTKVDTPGLNEGAAIPPDRQESLLGQATVDAIDLR